MDGISSFRSNELCSHIASSNDIAVYWKTHICGIQWLYKTTYPHSCRNHFLRNKRLKQMHFETLILQVKTGFNYWLSLKLLCRAIHYHLLQWVCINYVSLTVMLVYNTYELIYTYSPSLAFL